MAALSKEVFNDVASDCTTHNLLFHPWTKNCIKASPKMFIESCIGSTNFYVIVYLIQLVMQGKKLKSKKAMLNFLKNYAKSTAFGVLVAYTFVPFNCMLSKMFGLRTNHINAFFIPFALNSVGIYLEPPERRGLVINLFLNLLIEYWIKCLAKSGHLLMTKTKQTLLFMIGSSLLFYLMRLEGDKTKRTSLFWLYTAEKVKRKENDKDTVCPHNNSCQHFILKGFTTYFGIGLGLSLGKLLLPKLLTPIKAVSSIRPHHFKMAFFFGSYIGIYRAVICYLCCENGYDSALHALPAGFLSGISMLINPSTGIAIASVTAAMKLYSTSLYEKKILPAELPLPELLYCFCQSILFSARFLDKEQCPHYIVHLMDTVSRGNCEGLYQRALNHSKLQP